MVREEYICIDKESYEHLLEKADDGDHEKTRYRIPEEERTDN